MSVAHSRKYVPFLCPHFLVLKRPKIQYVKTLNVILLLYDEAWILYKNNRHIGVPHPS